MNEQRMLIGTAGEDLQKGDAVVWVHTDKGSMLYKARPEDVEDAFISQRFERVD